MAIRLRVAVASPAFAIWLFAPFGRGKGVRPLALPHAPHPTCPTRSARSLGMLTETTRATARARRRPSSRQQLCLWWEVSDEHQADAVGLRAHNGGRCVGDTRVTAAAQDIIWDVGNVIPIRNCTCLLYSPGGTTPVCTKRSSAREHVRTSARAFQLCKPRARNALRILPQTLKPTHVNLP